MALEFISISVIFLTYLENLPWVVKMINYSSISNKFDFNVIYNDNDPTKMSYRDWDFYEVPTMIDFFCCVIGWIFY